MRIRHRIPSIFNLSMVDVLCCALGCVILLWLLNMKDARQHAVAASETDHVLEGTRQELDQARKEFDDLMAEYAGLLSELSQANDRVATTRGQLLAVETRQRDLASRLGNLRTELTAVETREADTKKRLTAAEKRAAELATGRDKALDAINALMKEYDVARKELARRNEAYTDLERELKNESRRLLAAQAQRDTAEKTAAENARRADELAKRLNGANARIKELAAKADLVPGLRDEAKKLRDKAAAEEAMARALEKEIAKRLKASAEDAKTLDALRGDKLRLEKDLAARDRDLAAGNKELASARRFQFNAENRFEGIALTGRRVVFLVDKSGSMNYVDYDTKAPEKWKGVRDTVAKIMRSLPDLKEFQVIVFADDASFLLGQANRWIDYDPKTSPDRVLRALEKTEVKGGTNMYAAIQAAFRLRDSGLDTIYLLSDGLPNLGEGLTAKQQDLKEVEIGEILGKYIRTKLKEQWNRPREGSGTQKRVRINAVGFFYESPDVGAFLWALARENDGSFVGMSKP
jgi:hypothetical protein